MRSIVHAVALSTMLGLFAAPAMAADATEAPTWPETHAGEVAKGWVTAFNTGEAAMKEFITTRQAASALRDRSLPVRVARYRELREQYGKLQLDRVVKSDPYELTTRLLDADAKSWEFVFKSEDRAPWKLVSVSIKQQMHHGFGFPGHGN